MIRTNRHSQNTPRGERDCGLIEYLTRRFISSLFYFRVYRRLHPDRPLYSPGGIRRIEDLLSPESCVFEWGSGVSTVWYARRVDRMVSVEHDQEWHRKGSLALQQGKLDNVDLRFAPPVASGISRWESEWPPYALLGHPPAKPEFYDYMRAIDDYPDAFFDCIAIDGRERIGCLAHALPKLSETGFIVLDDSHRPGYAEFFDILSDWKTERFDFGLIQTTVFTRRKRPVE